MVIPLSVSRWLAFSHGSVASAALFFGSVMFNLSGTINVLLFLIVRPQLLLFTPPEELGEPAQPAQLEGERVGVLEVDADIKDDV